MKNVIHYFSTYQVPTYIVNLYLLSVLSRANIYKVLMKSKFYNESHYILMSGQQRKDITFKVNK